MICKYLKNDGIRCSAASLKNGDFCFTHEPQTKQAHQEASIKGGNAPKKNNLDLLPVSIKNISDVIALIENTVNDVRSGVMPVRTANCLGYLANVAIRALEISDLEKRVEAVEALIGERKNPTIKYD